MIPRSSLAVLVFHPLLAIAFAPPYAGAEACRSCHPNEFAQQRKSAHASSLAPSQHPAQPGDWAFGSGDQAITFVARKDPDHYVELGETWYRKLGAMGPTPGHSHREDILYRIFDPSAAILRCFSCHSTGPVSLTADHSITPHEAGVRCEACHGPAGDHAKDPSTHAMQNPGGLSASAQNELCGQCHRMPAAAGDNTNIQNPWNARHQPLLLARSACFRESAGRLACTTCHSPHAALEKTASVYDAQCKGCHPAAKHSLSIAGRACTGCHMPKVQAGAYLQFTNHRIAIYSPGDPMSALSGTGPH